MILKFHPGSMGLAYDLHGLVGNRLRAGAWGTPVWVVDCTQEEMEFFRELYEPRDITVEIEENLHFESYLH